eukprot:3992281-Prymnesium_polylepis.2
MTVKDVQVGYTERSEESPPACCVSCTRCGSAGPRGASRTTPGGVLEFLSIRLAASLGGQPSD